MKELGISELDEFGCYKRVSVDTTLFPIDIVLKTLYWFTEEYYIQLSLNEQKTTLLDVVFRTKDFQTPVSENLIGEFCNSLLDQKIRHFIQKETTLVRDIVVKRAFSEALSKEELEKAKKMGL